MEIIKQRFAEHITLAQQVAESRILEQVAESAEIIRRALQNGKKVLFCGNGGSAADSQHLAAEFVGRFQKERNGLPAIALTVDTSILTAVANDYGYDTVFAKTKGIQCIGMTAQGGGKMAEVCDICMAVPCPVTARAQEIHILIGHILCELVDGE